MKTKLMFAAALLGATATLYADPGFIALEGSDAVAFHEDAGYTAQLFKYLQGASSKAVLVYNTAGVLDVGAFDGGVATFDTTTLTGLTLSDYSAIYVETPGTCCSADQTALDGFGAAVNAFIAAGGNVSIENYAGGGYDGVVPGGATAPAGSIDGVGTSTGPFCTDGERVNANGLAKGFTQPAIDGCWSHQGYESSYWLGLGYISLMDSATDATDAASGGPGGGFTYADGTQVGSSFLAFGGTLGSSVPEPGTFALLGFALAGLVAGRKRLAARV